MSVVLGVRIEFYRHSGDDEPSVEGFLGAAARDAGFAAIAVPATGDLLSLATLTGGRDDLPIRAFDEAAFVSVLKVEHQPVAIEHGDLEVRAPWWEAPVDAPTATVVVRAAGPTSPEEARSLVGAMTEMGWTVMPGSDLFDHALHGDRG